MAKPTIKGLQEQLDSYRETLDLVTKDNSRLYKEIEKIKADKDVVSKKEYDALVNGIQLLEMHLEEYKNLYNQEKQKCKTKHIKNSRNAGRKPTQNIIKNKAVELKEQDLSIRAIAKELNIAVGTVHKIINEHMKDSKPMAEEEYNEHRNRVNALRKGLRDLGHTHKGTEDLPMYEEYIKNF